MKSIAYELTSAPVRVEASSLEAPVVTYLVESKTWRLEEDYTHQDGLVQITVPDRFEFDLASVPRLLWWLISPFDLSVAAPLVHDFLYRHSGEPPNDAVVPPRVYERKEADLLFRRIMKQEGVWLWRRVAAYWAVRSFGVGAWGGGAR